jgi:hypothetical protein
MTFAVSIRDDDTCYFTTPQVLQANYGEVWDLCPVSLAVVPFHACTKSGAVPREFWQGDQIFPVGDNSELVKFLREKIDEGKVYLAMHGYSHKDEPDGFEFETGQNLEPKVSEGKRYLEQTFGVPIRIFVPPHNTLSRAGYQAVVSNGLSICGPTGLRHRPLGWESFRFALGRRWWRWRKGGPYPYPLRYATHAEIGYQCLTPSVSPESLWTSLAHYRKWQGWFCLATHYWEFGATLNDGSGMTVGQVFKKFWEEVSRLPNVSFRSLGEINDSNVG